MRHQAKMHAQKAAEIDAKVKMPAESEYPEFKRPVAGRSAKPPDFAHTVKHVAKRHVAPHHGR